MRMIERAAGAVLLLAMLVLGTYAVLETGTHRRTHGTARPSGGPPGPPDVVGLVERYDTDVLVVSPDGHVALTRGTVVMRTDGPGTVADLRPGAIVAAWGRTTWDGRCVADTILVAPPPA